MRPQISLFASAARPRYWKRFYDSLMTNKVTYEVIFIGPNAPLEPNLMPDNFLYYHSDCKPAQCYEAAARLAQGDLIGWTADDADYSMCPEGLDIIWNRYLNSDRRTIFSQRTIEDYSKYGLTIQWINHRFVHGNMMTPMMAPMGFMDRKRFFELGGYDKNFVCGQSENDIVMRNNVAGGRVEGVLNSVVFLRHSECHVTYDFNLGYVGDRQYLESCWLSEKGEISLTRLKSFEPYEDENILTENQGPAGRWEIVNAK